MKCVSPGLPVSASQYFCHDKYKACLLSLKMYPRSPIDA